MVLISQGQVATVSKNVPTTLNIRNVDQTKTGSCQITGQGISINLQIPANSTQGANINGNSVKVTNSGKPILEVPGGVVKRTNFLEEINEVQDKDDVQEIAQTLQAKWYNTLVSQLGLNPRQFQMLQPSSPLGDTSDLLWAYFNNLPPQSLSSYFTVSGGNRFYDDYRAVLSQLSSQNDGAFRRDLSDTYGAWIEYVSKLNPLPDPSHLPDVFRTWALIHAPDKAQKGATDLENFQNDPIFLANQAVQNQSSFVNGVPNFSQTIDDLRDAIQGAEKRSINFDSSTASSDISNTWAQGQISGFYDIFTGAASGNYSQLTAKTASSKLTVQGTFEKVLTFSANPGAWYNSGALGAAYNTPDNTLWKHGTPNWDSTFGINGNMHWFTSSIIVVDGIDMTITSEATFSSDEQTEIEANLKVGIWPFFSLGSSGGYTHEVSFSDTGSMTLRISNPRGNPVVIGANVLPARSYITSQVGLNRGFMPITLVVNQGVPAHSEMNFPGRPQGYVIRISKQRWNHPVTYVVRSTNGATIAAGQVRPRQADSDDILIHQNQAFRVINVGVWPLTVSYP